MNDRKRVMWDEDERAIARRLEAQLSRKGSASNRLRRRVCRQNSAGMPTSRDAGAVTAYLCGTLQIGDETIPLLEIASGAMDGAETEWPPAQLSLVMDAGVAPSRSHADGGRAVAAA